MKPLKVGGYSHQFPPEDYMDPEQGAKPLKHWLGVKHNPRKPAWSVSTLSANRFWSKGKNVDLKEERFIWCDPQEEINLLKLTPYGQLKAHIL